MSKLRKSKHTAKAITDPSNSGYIAAAGALLLLLFICIQVIDLCEFTRKKIAIDHLRNATTEVNYAAIESAARRSSSTQGLAKFTNSLFARHSTISGETLIELVETSKQVEMNQFKYATQLLEAVRAKLPPTYNANEASTSNVDLGDPLVRTSHALSEASKIYSLMRNVTREGEAIQAEQAEIYSEYQKISKEVLDFFSLPLSRSTKEIEFYQKGVLKGLPTIQNLTDQMEDLTEFATALDKLGGRVNVPEGENAHQFFIDKLQDFQDRSFALALRKQSYDEKHSTTSDHYQTNNKELEKFKTVIKTTLLTAVADYCDNDLVLNYEISRNNYKLLNLL